MAFQYCVEQDNDCQAQTVAIVAPFLPLPGHALLTCLKFVRSQELSSVDTADIVGDVSFVHTYGNGCNFLEDAGVRQVEREQAVVAERLLFQHDFLLTCSCFNHLI